MKLQNKHVKKIFLTFLFIFGIIVFSFFNIFTLILTCSDVYCYYKKCHHHSFHDKTECFFDKTDDLGDWILLDLFSLSIYFTILMTIIISKIFYKNIINFYYKNKNFNNSSHINRNINNIFEPRETEIDIDENFNEELQTEERDPLLNV